MKRRGAGVPPSRVFRGGSRRCSVMVAVSSLNKPNGNSRSSLQDGWSRHAHQHPSLVCRQAGGAIGTPVSRVCFHGSASRGSIYLFWFCNVHLSGPPLLTPVKMMRSALSLTRPEMLNSKQRLQHALGVCGGGRPSLSPNKLKHSY